MQMRSIIHTRANRSSLIQGTKYFHGQISIVVTAFDFLLASLDILVADDMLGYIIYLAATSIENS